MKSPSIKNLLFFLIFLCFYLLRLGQIHQYQIPENQTVKIIGRVSKQPYQKGSKQIIEVGPVLIMTNLFPGYFYGDKLSIIGKFQKKVINPFQFQYFASFPAIHLEKDNFSLIGKTGLTRFLLKTRGQIESRIKGFLPENESALLLGVLLGVKTELSENFWQNLRKTGTLHLIVASGQNVVFISSIVMSICLWFLSRKQALAITLVFIFLYVLMVGGEASVIRAGLMVGLSFCAQLFGREGNSFRFLLISAAFMLLVSPLMLFDVGFQLSFGATAGLILVSPKLKELMPRLFVLPLLSEGLILTLSAQIMTLPILLTNFGQFSWLSPLINSLVLPLIPLIMILGLIVVVLSFLFMPLAQLLSWLVFPFLTYFVHLVNFFSQLKGISWEIGTIPLVYFLPYYFLIFFWVLKKKTNVKLFNS
ncbi:MAG: ComEC/Rec2 family competence protein [Candidatus Shapirobacteria bacterium]|nr:ComEC/Rec2 family competence protein [Candidatus Shapirobacteria bacterium]